jgi:cytochrome b pre-mRNA-processing protein 3
MKAEQTPTAKSLVTRLVDRLSIPRHLDRIRLAEAYYQACTRQASDPRWYGPGRIPRDFRHRHAVLTMHVWFLHKRLISDQVDAPTARLVQGELFKALWDDTVCRIRQLGVRELSLSKHLKQVTEYTLSHLTSYDKVYTDFLDKPGRRIQALRKIVWRHILVRSVDSTKDEGLFDENSIISMKDMNQLNRITWYIEANYQNILMDLPDTYYRQGRIAWVDLPDFTNAQEENGEEDEGEADCPTVSASTSAALHPDDVLPAPWLKNVTLKGIDYYWNPETMESTWERPMMGE